MNNYPYLKDSAFLKQIDELKRKEQYIEIIVLNKDEKPIVAIQGKTVGGNLNLDGNSAIRRTCNLEIIADKKENNLTDIRGYLSINKKVSIKIGFLNETEYYKEYKFIWFPMGVYLIINPSISNSSNGISISLQLKDKMSLLNGECGGIIPASVTFHEYETINENGEYVIQKPTIYKIIQELVNHFGGEQLGKIIISDVDNRIKQIMKWVGSSPLYIIKRTSNNVTQYFPTTDINVAAAAGTFNTYEYGEDIGYVYTDFTYPGELIGDAGSSVCDILDQIKNLLGNYEYFYDVNGNFIFREIKNYLNTSYSSVELDKINNNNYLVDYNRGKSLYTFENSNIITAYSNSPQYSMIKNDFVVWGIRETAEGSSYPIRYHLAIDQKPKIGNTYYVFFYEDKNDKIKKAKTALNFLSKSNFPTVGQEELFYRAENENKVYKWDSKTKQYVEVQSSFVPIVTKDWRTELYLSGAISEPLATDSNYYYTELNNEWPKLYDIENGKFYDNVLKNSSDIDFYLDFIDSTAAISELSVSNIGRRTKVVNDSDINCVFEPEIPNLVLLNNEDENLTELRKECEDQGQDYIQMSSDLFTKIAVGGKFNSAYNMVRELLYQYTSYNESITVTALPIFYLEPNSRVTVRDTGSGIYGDYIINRITLPFDINGTMTLSGVRALERI